jgi:hypothetical protein
VLQLLAKSYLLDNRYVTYARIPDYWPHRCFCGTAYGERRFRSRRSPAASIAAASRAVDAAGPSSPISDDDRCVSYGRTHCGDDGAGAVCRDDSTIARCRTGEAPIHTISAGKAARD